MDAAGVLTLGTSLTCAGCCAALLGRCGYLLAERKVAPYRTQNRGDRISLESASRLLEQKVFELLAHVPKIDKAMRSMRNQRLKRELKSSLPQAMRLLCISLDSSGSLQQALEYAAENSSGVIAKELRRAVWDIKAGRSFDEAMEGLRSRTGKSEFTCLVIAMEIQHRCGGTLGQILASVSEMLQQSAELEEDLITKTTQAKLSARVVALMPLVVLALISLVSPGYLGQFFESASGFALLVLAVLMELAGVALVKRSMAVDLGPGG